MHGLEHELRTHAGALRALALRLVGPSRADDLVQETSLLAWSQRPDDCGGLGGWLRSVLRHRAGKLQRGDARRLRREQIVARDDIAPSPADVAAQRESMTTLHQALLALPAPYQGVLLQRFFQDMTPTAIAAQGGVPVATVKSQLQRGLALLRERLDAHGDRDWRAAFAGAFGLPAATAPVAVGTAGAMLMSTKIVWLGGVVAAALLCAVLWPGVEAPPPALVRGAEQAAVAGATVDEATDAAPERREAAVAAAPLDATTTAPLRIRLVDSFDGAPLPHFHVLLQRDDVAGTATARSDERAELEIGSAFRDHDVTVVALDEQRLEAIAEHLAHAPRATISAQHWPAARATLDVPLAVGPTYQLLFDVTPPDDDLRAVLVPDAYRVRPERDEAEQPVHAGTPPWVRFTAARANPSKLGDGPWTLVVFGPAWMAAGPVQQIRGAQRAPVLLRSCALGTLRAGATIDGRPVTGEPRLSVTVYPLDHAGEPVDDGGRTAAVPGELELPVGRYRVFVLGPDRQTHREDVTIVAATTTSVRAEFRAATAKPTLQVVMRSQTGTRNVGNLPHARRVGGTEQATGRYLRAGENNAALYEFAGLLPGDWDVSLDPTPHLPPWDATTKRVSAEAGTVEFVCLDAGAPPTVHGSVRVVDEATKAPIDGAGVTTVQDGMHFLAPTSRDGLAITGPCLAGRPVHVLVRAAGYAPAWFELTPVAASDPPPHEVTLRPGWGTLLMLGRPTTEHSRGEPVPGVRVLVDGTLAGTTDARGFLLLSTASRPSRLEFLHDEYVHDYGGVDTATGTPIGDAQHPFHVVMKPKGAK